MTPPTRAELDLASIVSLHEFRALAADRVEAAAFDYVDGGAWDEVSLAENEAADSVSIYRLNGEQLSAVQRKIV